MNDLLGQALENYLHEPEKQKLWIHNRYGNKEQMPVATYFRDENKMPDLEWLALEQCSGKVLDIGAGAGSHSLALQNRGIAATAIDNSPGAVKVMQSRGVKVIVEGDIIIYKEAKFDTLLLLMNGIGLAGTMGGLNNLLQHFKTLLAPGGQVLFDSSNIAYFYEDKPKPDDRYYGEIWYRYGYKRHLSDWFPWLYVDEHSMYKAATAAGFKMDVLLEDEFGQYLARLTQ